MNSNTKQHTILLVDDEPDILDFLTYNLKKEGYKVYTATNGKEAVELVNDVGPSLVLLDVMMPNIDGVETCQIIRNDLKITQPIIAFLTSRSEDYSQISGFNAGADDYITKPFSEDELLSAINSRLAKASILKDRRIASIETAAIPNELKSLNDLKNFFDDYGQEFNFKMNDLIYEEGDDANFIYLIAKGAVKCHKLDEQGKELGTGLFKEDDLFGYTSFTYNLPHRETAKAIKDTQLFGMALHDLLKVLENNHKLAISLIDLLTGNLTELKDQLLKMAYSSVNKKTASTIVQFAEKINRRPTDPLKISRNDLASVAGVATETFIRALTNFKNDGLIKSEGRNIVVVDLEALKKLS